MARILIVDDELAIVMAVKDELLLEGYEVDMASDGPPDLEKAHTFEPDVMLLDEARGFSRTPADVSPRAG